MREEWRQCTLPGLSELQVSSLGNVRAEKRIATYIYNGVVRTQHRAAQTFSPWIGKNGYFHISVKRRGERKKYLVHRLVALAFIPTKSILLSVNHRDCNKLNNRVENLEWCTLAENTKMQWRDGLVNLRGDLQPGAKLRAEFIPTIRSLKGVEPAIAVASRYGVSAAAIYLVWHRKRWAHV